MPGQFESGQEGWGRDTVNKQGQIQTLKLHSSVSCTQHGYFYES